MRSNVADSDARGVAIRVAEFRRRGPGPAARDHHDARTSITYIVRELWPLEVRFDFIEYIDTERPGEREFVPVGFALDRPVTMLEANSSPDTVEMTAAQWRTFSENFFQYRRIAELRLRFQNDDANQKHVALSGKKRWRDHQLLVEEYRSREGDPFRMYSMAIDLDCNRATIHRHLRAACAEGLISKSELEFRK